MTASMAGSTYPPSITRANAAIGVLSGYFGVRNGLTMIVGTAATAPTVFSDFVTVDFGTFGNGQLAFVTLLNVIEGNTVTKYTFQAFVTSGGAVGDHAFIAMFENANPSGSDPVLAVAGPFIVGP